MIRTQRTPTSSGKQFLLVVALLQSLMWPVSLYSQPAEPMEDDLKPAAELEKVEAEQAEELPLLSELALPDFKDLLEGPKQDWIVMIGDRVLQVPAIWPRPQHLTWLEVQQKQLLDDRPKQDDLEFADWLEDYRRFSFLYLPIEQEGVEEDYRMHIRYVDKILYHEDLCLLQVDNFLKQRELLKARQLLTAVKRWEFENNKLRETERLKPIPWPGLLTRERDLLRTEVQLARQESDWETAFNLIQRRFVIDPEDPVLHRFCGELLDQMLPEFLASADYRRARYYLQQTRQRFPNHARATYWQQQFIQQAQQLMTAAEQAARSGQSRNASIQAQYATRIWPFSSQLNRRLQILQEQYQTLEVGIAQQTHHPGPIINNLRHEQWFYVAEILEGYPRFQSRYLESWRPLELGRTVRLEFVNQPDQSRTSAGVVSQLFARKLSAESLQRTSNQRDLFANFMTRIDANTPGLVEVGFHSPTPHPLAWIAAIVRPRLQPADPELQDQRFQPLTHIEKFHFEPQGAIYRNHLLSDRSQLRNEISEIRIQQFEDSEELLRSLLRDDLHLLPETPLEFVDNLKNDQRFRVIQYHVPRNCSLRFALNGQLSGQPELRLALFKMLDRERMQDAYTPPNDPAQPHVQLVNSISPSSSHAWSASELIPPFDQTSSLALVVLLRNTPHFPQKITLKCPPTERIQRVAEYVRNRWTLLGIEVTITTKDDTEPEDGEKNPPASWDAELLETSLTAPHYQLPMLLTNQPRITVEELASFPVSIRSILMNLENARSWERVDLLLRQLQQQLVVNSWFLPVLESKRYMTIRKEIRNVPDHLIEPFDTLEQWAVEPVIPAY